jgi:hypothetical protein
MDAPRLKKENLKDLSPTLGKTKLSRRGSYLLPADDIISGVMKKEGRKGTDGSQSFEEIFVLCSA